MKIYTKTGDKGKTGLVDGSRIDKFDERLDAYGTVDELNSIIGVVISSTQTNELKESLQQIQHELFQIGSMLATPFENKEFKPPFQELEEDKYVRLEKEIDKFSEPLPELKSFILPGGSTGAARLHYARTVARRAERAVLKAAQNVVIDNNIIIYLNRLSDLLFTMARYENFVNKVEDVKWQQ